MFTLNHLQRRTTAFGLLLLFAGALLMAGACAIWCGPNHRGVVVATITPRASAAPHSCCAAKAAKTTKPASSSSEKPECCQHEKAAKWAAVPDAPFAKLLKAASPNAVALLPEGQVGWPAQIGEWAVLAPVRLVPSHHLPPKIPDRRVFLRSLIV
jgi:hypothetical protein